MIGSQSLRAFSLLMNFSFVFVVKLGHFTANTFFSYVTKFELNSKNLKNEEQ